MLDKLTNALFSNLGTKIISVVIAMVLWAIVLFSRNVEATKEVPIEVTTATDIVVANDLPEKVSFRLSGPKAFLRAILDRREEPIRINLAASKPGLVTYRFFSDNIHVPIGVKILSISPPAVLVKLENIKKREVPVRVDFRGTPPDGYRVRHVEVTPPTVRIKGPESRVDSVTEVTTTPIDVSGVNKDFKHEVPLELARQGIQLEGELPMVSFTLEPMSANYRIKNVDVRVLSSFKAKLDEKSVTVLVRASAEDLRNLNRSKVFAVIDLRGKPKGKYSEPVTVSLPENVSMVKVIPAKIDVTLY